MKHAITADIICTEQDSENSSFRFHVAANPTPTRPGAFRSAMLVFTDRPVDCEQLLGAQLRVTVEKAEPYQMEGLDFGEALRRLKAGRRIARAGWNGKNMWLVLIHPGNAMHASIHGSFDMQPCIGMKTANGVMQPGWLASQNDMLTDDWMELP